MLIENLPCTIFIDIDGTLINHKSSKASEQLTCKPQLLPGVIEKFCEWDGKGYKIILTTGRKESSRKLTEESLSALGLFWDQLIMGIGPSQRVLINDLKPNINAPTAIAINVERNKGLADISIEKSANSTLQKKHKFSCDHGL